jgi:hypothetical protein
MMGSTEMIYFHSRQHIFSLKKKSSTESRLLHQDMRKFFPKARRTEQNKNGKLDVQRKLGETRTAA